jgi:hypothetical protein
VRNCYKPRALCFPSTRSCYLSHQTEAVHLNILNKILI